MDQSNATDRAEHVTSDPAETGPHYAPPPPPLSARAWLTQNGLSLGFVAALFAVLYSQFGAENVLAGVVAVLGIGFIIFIHELGHFLAAKWCDVHVQTFSIGFGPALPGCSFTRGETTYKIALFPLGGYVNMVGEGPEADEDEDYPRSFKNKSVGARMLIISAGVVMNILFGAFSFVAVHRYFGVPQEPAVVWLVEPGGRAWKEGVRAGWKVVKLNNKDNPTFMDMKRAVTLSAAGKPLDFVFKDRQGKLHERNIEPSRDENGFVPVIGVSPAPQLKLWPERYRREIDSPVRRNSAAAYARVLELDKNDTLVKESWLDLCRRMETAADKPLSIEVAAGGDKGKSRTVDVPAVGFQFGDRIVATTDPATPDQPYNVSPLPVDPEQGPGSGLRDPFVFRTRMTQLAGKPIVIQVQRAEASESAPPVSLLVPPAYHVHLGMRMKMGKVAAIRPGSPAESVGLKAGSSDGDVITGVRLKYENEPDVVFTDKELDPVRLPYELDRRIHHPGKDVSKWQVILTVRGLLHHELQKERTLTPMTWDDSYALVEDTPIYNVDPMSIPQLGIAYWVENTVMKVEPGSPADKGGVVAGEVIREFRFRVRGKTPDSVTWSDWNRMTSARGKEKEVPDQWAQFFAWLQSDDYAYVRFKVKESTEELPGGDDKNAGIQAVPDRTWPAVSRGLLLETDTRIKKAKSMLAALELGVDETVSMIGLNYQSMSGLATRRISHKTLGGPIEIVYQLIMAARDHPWRFMQLLGIISIGLAVVNFLPIPVLDGGHMVFLIYEKLRGKPPSENVRIIATYAGLLLILGLMAFVFWQDIEKRIWPSIKGLFGG